MAIQMTGLRGLPKPARSITKSNIKNIFLFIGVELPGDVHTIANFAALVGLWGDIIESDQFQRYCRNRVY